MISRGLHPVLIERDSNLWKQCSFLVRLNNLSIRDAGILMRPSEVLITATCIPISSGPWAGRPAGQIKPNPGLMTQISRIQQGGGFD